MEELIKNTNFAKYKKEVFLKDSIDFNEVFKMKSTKLPEYIQEKIGDETENVIVVEDGNIIYDSLTLPIEIIYLNDMQSAKEEIPDYYIASSRYVNENLKNNIQINDILTKNNGGVALYLKNSSEVEKTIYIFNCSTIKDNVTNNLIFVGKNSKISIVEYNMNLGTNEYVLSNTDIIAQQGATVEYVNVCNLLSNTRNYGSIRAAIEADVTLNVQSIYENSKTTLFDIYVNIMGENCDVDVDNIAIANQEIINNSNVEIIHNAPYSKSDIHNVALTKDKAQITFNNSSVIKKDMVKTNARQKTTGIILSGESKISANPFLFIDCYDVQASHGASIGKFSDDDIFYLMSRGLTRAEAENLIVGGVIRPFVANVPSEIIKDELTKFINQRVGEIGE